MHLFLTRRWIVIHLFTLVIVVVCLSLAFWQFRRLEDRKADNARVAARAKLPTVDLSRLLPSAETGTEEVDAAAFRSVTVRGAYDMGEEVVLVSRGLKERPGNHRLTPLVTASGEAVLVDRGWVPLEGEGSEAAVAAPPSGTVTAAGLLLPSERKALFGVSDPPPGRVTAIPRIDLERLGGQLPYRLYPLYLRLEDQQPANAGPLPEPVPIPPPDEGPHFEYMLQWLLFAATALAIYVGMIRREIGRQRQDRDQPDEPDPVAV
jgi:cytochrome oxidase assembly protein ShyY1